MIQQKMVGPFLSDLLISHHSYNSGTVVIRDDYVRVFESMIMSTHVAHAYLLESQYHALFNLFLG